MDETAEREVAGVINVFVAIVPQQKTAVTPTPAQAPIPTSNEVSGNVVASTATVSERMDYNATFSPSPGSKMIGRISTRPSLSKRGSSA